MFNKILTKLLWWLEPFVSWFDHLFTIPFSVKQINADDYYLWRDKILKGMVFVTDTFGQGSNLLNPSKGKHGAIYFGRGLKTHLSKLLDDLHKQAESLPVGMAQDLVYKKIDRIQKVAMTKHLDDEICYVIEAVGVGVTVKNLVTFMTTKDRFKCYKASFASKEQLDMVLDYALMDLGLGYDYGFTDDDNYKYCFEVVVDAFKSVFHNLRLPTQKVFGREYYGSDSFKDDKLWIKVIDSDLDKRH